MLQPLVASLKVSSLRGTHCLEEGHRGTGSLEKVDLSQAWKDGEALFKMETVLEHAGFQVPWTRPLRHRVSVTVVQEAKGLMVNQVLLHPKKWGRWPATALSVLLPK